MSRTIITANLITPGEALENHALLIEGESIQAVLAPEQLQTYPGDRMLDLDDCWIAPGLIDLHVHGGNGLDVMDANPDAWDGLCRFFAHSGVTAFLLTTGTASREDIKAVIDLFQIYTPPSDGAVPLGIHLEGPYLNPAKKGAQPGEHLRHPDPEEYLPWLESGVVRLITLAPELPGALELIRRGRERGVKFSVGHSTASYRQMQQAVEAGLDQASHTFNAMEPLHHRRPGVLGTVLSDSRVYAQVIPDGQHVHPAVIRALAAAKGIERTMIITDAMRAAGMPDGEYQLLGQSVTVSAGAARLADGALAGSLLTMDQGLRNLVQMGEFPLTDAVIMASTAPAVSLDLGEGRGRLRPGARADLVVLNQDLSVCSTWIGGKKVG